MRYYEREHVEGYARIRSAGLDQWSDLHESLAGYHDFPNRAFLEQVLPPVRDGSAPRVLEYGCGTGPAACFLAGRGYTVRAVDLVLDAIDIARRRSAELGVSVEFAVEDVCAWPTAADVYDVVLDSFCLQSIVLDADRSRLLAGVLRRLGPEGRYVLSTSVLSPTRDYGRDLYDHTTGIVWTPTAGPAADAMIIGGAWYLPHRRHLTPAALHDELVAAGFVVLQQTTQGGDLVCAPSRRE